MFTVFMICFSIMTEELKIIRISTHLQLIVAFISNINFKQDVQNTD